MIDRSPSPVAGIALALSLAAVWVGVAVGTGLGWFAMAASVGIAWGWWEMQRGSRRLRSRALQFERAMQRLAGQGGEPAAPEALEGLIRGRLARASEEARSLRAVLDAVDEPVVALEAGGTIVAANGGAVALLAPGSSGPVVGEILDELLPDARALAAVGKARRGGAARAQATLLTGEGPRIIEVAAEPIGDGPFGVESPPAVVVTLRDVTEQATAMQLKTDFVANASHELRTPLASIMTAAETLRELGGDDPGLRERLVAMIASNAERLEELSRDLLDLSSLESPGAACVIERVDLGEIAEGLSELFAGPCAQRRVGLEFELDKRLGAVWTDARLVRLVLRNLVDNAVKFADEDTVVRVRGSVLAAGGDGSAEGRPDARLEVIDRGIGIPIAQQQRVFERFFQADAARSGSPRRRGTGLGLAIVKHALRALGGSIKVESVWQQGTTMTVELPGCVDAE